MPFVLTKDPGTTVFATLPRGELEATVFTTLGAAATGKIRIEPDPVEEWGLAFISVGPPATDYTLDIVEDLPTVGLSIRYTLAKVAADLESGEILIPLQVSFKHPVEIHLTNDGGGATTFTVTYKLLQKSDVRKL